MLLDICGKWLGADWLSESNDRHALCLFVCVFKQSGDDELLQRNQCRCDLVRGRPEPISHTGRAWAVLWVHPWKMAHRSHGAQTDFSDDSFLWEFTVLTLEVHHLSVYKNIWAVYRSHEASVLYQRNSEYQVACGDITKKTRTHTFRTRAEFNLP